MSNIDTLFNVRPALEEGFRGLFAAQDIPAFTRQNVPEDFQLVRPRVELAFKIGAATGHRHVTPPGVIQNDAWFFEAAFFVPVAPENTEPDNLEINQFVARVRGMASTFGQSTWVDTDNFPNHLIVEPLKDTSTGDTLKADDNIEYSILTFSGIVQIRTAAWNN